jgi:hypothetical protein
MVYFSPKGLCGLLRRNGLRIKWCEIKNVEPHEILKFFRPQASENRQRDQELRCAIEDNVFLRAAKNSVNFFLNLTKLGESIFILAEKM